VHQRVDHHAEIGQLRSLFSGLSGTKRSSLAASFCVTHIPVEALHCNVCILSAIIAECIDVAVLRLYGGRRKFIL
jgi:hypothetical protein